MATLPYNIEKSAFRKSEYIGYSGTMVWRIQKTNSSFGNWQAYNNSHNIREASTFLYGFTLKQISDKLNSYETRA